RKKRRGLLIGLSVGILSLAGILVLFALRDSIVFFVTPSEIANKTIPEGKRFRLGGLVENGSVIKKDNAIVEFVITDTIANTNVKFTGILPDLFREGQGVVAEGRLNPKGVFEADTVLAKHDENYMPPDVAKALKEKGVLLGKTADQSLNKGNKGSETP
ncbi:MAG: cytochrome c maturation protein CcmE, partial [Hyphomicrobium sp.]